MDRLATVIADRLEKEIIGLGWPAGHTLGSESELTNRFGVSRATFREAARLLEHKQIARMRRGPNGGLLVHAPAAAAVVESMATFFEFSAVPHEAVLTARRPLQVLAARLAVERARVDPDGARAELVRAQGADGPHHAIARLSGNPALAIFISALLQVTPHPVGGRRLPHTDALVAAVLDGDLDEVELRVLDAVDESAEGTDGGPVTVTTDDELKVPERAARMINERIRAAASPPGTVVGSEASLIASLEISRGTFREAVRVLEYYGIAAMRRGVGGGLVVREPDPSRVVGTVVAYLDFLRIEPEQLLQARAAVELATVELAAARLDERNSARLAAGMRAEYGVPGDRVYTVQPELHRLLGELSGNLPLQLFVAVLTRLQTTRLDSHPTHAEGEDARATHERLVAAVAARDPMRARHEMARHLDVMRFFLDRGWTRRP
ncbi:FadR/GntR family transcriptional regulator [Pseudonocardia humida]|uniref:FadR family transcriptional regulator n=1 Tax=Pseudonocardia humida TaxID=2800819 RepID=A0ABT1A248_9PSEU|nr:GntR family transcriptional regulator [Pseudonocardia humida]MCO1657036.1 FadR family transcriptional regulator [Pseudonocardia humida]